MEDYIIEIKNKLHKTGISGVALDIDETLSWTVGYWVEQMQLNFGNPENLTVRQLIEKYRFTQNVPYWQTEEAIEWMDEHRNSNEIQELLPLIEYADKNVLEINKILPIVLYITTRPQSVVEGTKKWLSKHNFPDVEIIARPPQIHVTEGNKWKAGVLEFLYPEVASIIDDNPGLVIHLPEHYKGTVYLYDNVETSRTDITIIPCKTWDDVLKKIQDQNII